jgi:flagellar hook-basal body complex protein FliE
MSPKTPHNPASAPRTAKESNLATEFSDLVLKGLQRAADMQKQSLEAAAQLHAQTLEALKKTTPNMPGATSLFDLAGQAMEKYVQAQKGVIDQVVQQTAAVIETTKQQTGSASKLASDVTKTIQESIERVISMQKAVLDLASKK